jgi:hypothetical protein
MIPSFVLVEIVKRPKAPFPLAQKGCRIDEGRTDDGQPYHSHIRMSISEHEGRDHRALRDAVLLPFQRER